MREIKFRIWDAYHGFMSVNNETPLVGNILNAICGQDEPLNDEEKKRFKLMQYTGLKDRNGKKIYEGDIMKLKESKENYEVRYLGNRFILCKYDNIVFENEAYFSEREVVGNIYENPELLKDTK